MFTAKQKTLIEQAIDKLHEADALMQAALGASEECYSLHNAIENIAEEIAEHAETLMEFDND